MNNRIYEIWKWIGKKLNVLKHHNIIVGKSWLDTRRVLEEGFNSQLKQDSIKEKS